jgi:hypothetical protein
LHDRAQIPIEVIDLRNFVQPKAVACILRLDDRVEKAGEEDGILARMYAARPLIRDGEQSVAEAVLAQ